MPNSSDGGKTWQGTSWPPKGMFVKAFGDFRVMWWDQQNPNRILVGSDGGFYISYDRGKTADHYMNIPVGEFYAVDADMADPYNVYGGMQDHDSWKGPSNSWSGEVNARRLDHRRHRRRDVQPRRSRPTRAGSTTPRSSAITGASTRCCAR